MPAYGSHLFGQGTLLARRLLEAGAAFVTVDWHYEGPLDSPVWDTHEKDFRHLRERFATPTDAAVASLLADLADRGLLADTLVICLGEFGRTPRVNGKAGRDHWPHVQSALLAGAGIPGGTVYGASDAAAHFPTNHMTRERGSAKPYFFVRIQLDIFKPFGKIATLVRPKAVEEAFNEGVGFPDADGRVCRGGSPAQRNWHARSAGHGW